MNSRLTTKAYWESTYEKRSDIIPVEVSGFKNRLNRKILAIKEPYFEGIDSVIEIGGGGSGWLAYLVGAYPSVEFSSLDYSDVGNLRLHTFVEKHGVDNLTIHSGDFFSESNSAGLFDLVYSHGVVEHFDDLSGVLSAHARFLRDKGFLVTIIPNMAGLNGTLTRWFDEDIYNIHVPHGLESFKKGHLEAGLNIVASGYLGAVNFGVLSSCERKAGKLKWVLLKLLSRVGHIVWAFEDSIRELPETKTFAPYIYAVSEKRKSDV